MATVEIEGIYRNQPNSHGQRLAFQYLRDCRRLGGYPSRDYSTHRHIHYSARTRSCDSDGLRRVKLVLAPANALDHVSMHPPFPNSARHIQTCTASMAKSTTTGTPALDPP